MEYTLLDKIKITRPIIFLCGPYYDKNNKSDRRLLLQQKIYDRYRNKFLPLVIDDFLTEKNIKDKSISIQLMEEICAAISTQTYIFLDTISSAAELGIFANSAYFNKIKVYIPKTNDIYNRGNVGYFVKDVVLQKHADRVDFIEYRPGIIRKAIATDYIVEHYSFVNDKLPVNIEQDIDTDKIFIEDDEHFICIKMTSKMPDDPYQICFQCQGNKLHIHTSIKLFFYVTISIMYCLYKDLLISKDKDFGKINISLIDKHVKESFSNYIGEKKNINVKKYSDVIINTVLKVDQGTLIKHIAKFVHVYYLYSQFHSTYLMTDPIGKIVDEIEIGIHPNSFFNLSDEQYQLLNEIEYDKDSFYEQIEINTNGKKRTIVKYKKGERGEQAKRFHQYLCQKIYQKYTANENSFAYQKQKSIKKCVMKHIGGTGFIKYDIKKFFNSISFDKMVCSFMNIFNIDYRFKKQIEKILASCFYDKQLPLGLVSSPLLSDIYLYVFDKELDRKLNVLGLVYTRYADDILISSINGINETVYQKVEKIISGELEKVGLILNDQKKQYFNFDERHSFIRYLGINIVRGNDNNYLSVGKAYIYEIAKEYMLYQRMKKDLLESDSDDKNSYIEKDIFYKRMILIGKIGFVKQIEGERGFDRLKTRLKKYEPNIDITAI